MIDLNGTIHIKDKPININAPASLLKLKNSHFDYKFVTNTSKESREFIISDILKAKFDKEMFNINNIISSTSATV